MIDVNLEQVTVTLSNGVTYSTEGKKFAYRMPKGMREGHNEEIACAHRDVSVCNECANTYANLIEVYGVHYWVRDFSEWCECIAEFGALSLSRDGE